MSYHGGEHNEAASGVDDYRPIAAISDTTKHNWRYTPPMMSLGLRHSPKNDGVTGHAANLLLEGRAEADLPTIQDGRDYFCIRI